jgi:hypothetical protein
MSVFLGKLGLLIQPVCHHGQFLQNKYIHVSQCLELLVYWLQLVSCIKSHLEIYMGVMSGGP